MKSRLINLIKSVVICKIPDRKIFKLYGSDSTEFLQGITTNDITNFTTNDGHPVKCSLFLNPQGKIIADCFIININSDYLIDVGGRSYNDLLNLIQRRKLSSKIDILPMSTQVFQVLPPLITCNHNLNISKEYFNDPRNGILGRRLLCDESVIEHSFVREHLTRENSIIEQLHYYRIILRYLNMVENVGYGYGTRVVPHDVDMDIETYISRTKGCYTGQEVVNKLRNRLLFPRYKLIPKSIVDDELLDDRVDDILKEYNLDRDLLKALINYIDNKSCIEYRMDLMHRI